MAPSSTRRRPAAPPVAFVLDEAAVAGGRLVLTGRWRGVRGVRFVRPALVLEERDLLATLEHKPWAVFEDATWTVAFPWPAEEPPDLSRAQLAVAPSITVPLDPEFEPLPDPAAGLAEQAGRLQHEVDVLRGRRDDELGVARQRITAVEDARDTLRERLAAAEADAASLGAALTEARAERAALRERLAEAERSGVAQTAESAVPATSDELAVREAAIERGVERLRAAERRMQERAAELDDRERELEARAAAPAPAAASAPAAPPAAAPAPAPDRLPGIDRWAQRIIASTAAVSLLLLLLGLVKAL